jgi:hypothetical protein
VDASSAIAKFVTISYKPPDQSDEGRPRVTGWFIEPGGHTTPLLVAVGRAVFAAAGLEHALQLELVRLILVRQAADGSESNLDSELRRLRRLTAGALLTELGKRGLATELHERIRGAIERRNDLVHRTVEDPELSAGLGRGEGLDPVVARTTQLAAVCGELTVELVAFAIPKILEHLDLSLTDVIRMMEAADPATIPEPDQRRRIEAIRGLGDLRVLMDVFEELGVSPTHG